MEHRPGEPDRCQEFVGLFAVHAQRLYALIYSLLPHAADADDVFQETSKLLWERFGEFTPGTNFFAWACRIAQYQVMASRQRQRRSRVQFSDEFLTAVTQQASSDAALLAAQHRALADCLQKLKARERTLVEARYQPGVTTAELATRVGRSLEAIYKALQRAQQRLLECVQRSLVREGFDV
jgi:RNA polymerase sigma-70 factor (ECF subfamily)